MSIYSTSHIQTSHPPTSRTPTDSVKRVVAHIKWEYLEPSIPTGERDENGPPLWGPQSRPYLMTRVLKWNKSAIKKGVLAIETLLMQQPGRGNPGVTWQYSPFNCIFGQVFVPLDWQVDAECAWPHFASSCEWENIPIYLSIMLFQCYTIMNSH